MQKEEEIIVSKSQPEIIVNQIRTRILSGELLPGEKLSSEREFAKTLKVSRITLRTALNILQREGLIIRRRGQHGGTYIGIPDASIDIKFKEMQENIRELEDILDFRSALESKTVELATVRRTQYDLDALKSAIDQLDTVSNRVEFRKADTTFHNCINKASANAWLARAIRDARSGLWFPFDKLVYTESIEETKIAHLNIYHAIKDQDPKLAAEEMIKHIEKTRMEIRTILMIERRMKEK
jgi:GntR family transcriptional regulator, transcriptional repressor for pyruvate dehydrogenase complex